MAVHVASSFGGGMDNFVVHAAKPSEDIRRGLESPCLRLPPIAARPGQTSCPGHPCSGRTKFCPPLRKIFHGGSNDQKSAPSPMRAGTQVATGARLAFELAAERTPTFVHFARTMGGKSRSRRQTANKRFTTEVAEDHRGGPINLEFLCISLCSSATSAVSFLVLKTRRQVRNLIDACSLPGVREPGRRQNKLSKISCVPGTAEQRSYKTRLAAEG